MSFFDRISSIYSKTQCIDWPACGKEAPQADEPRHEQIFSRKYAYSFPHAGQSGRFGINARYSYFFGFLILSACLCLTNIAQAAESLPPEVIRAVVLVQCGTRQGSGTVINNVSNYVLTNAHVVMDVETGLVASSCRVGFVEQATEQPRYYYRAQVIKNVFQPEGNLDFAILQITQQLTVQGAPQPFPMLLTDEFPLRGDSIQVAGFSGAEDHLVISNGMVEGFEQGFIQTSAQLSPGNSGGAAINSQHHLIGIPTRIVTFVGENSGVTGVTYELVDIRAVMNWLDLFGENEHDHYFTHTNRERYHQQELYAQDASLGCEAIVKLNDSSTVYCLLTNNERLVFPNSPTFRSWYPDFTQILLITPQQLSRFRIKENARFKPGTLVKSATSPKVYIVVDSLGTLRWIPNEEKAIALWGLNWAGLVKDIPDEFWFNYRVSSTQIE